MLVQFPGVSRRPLHTPLRKHRGVEGAAAVVRLVALDVVASAKREVGAPRSGGVVVIVHTATGGVADVTAGSRSPVADHTQLGGMDTGERITCSSDSGSKSRRTVVLSQRRPAGVQGIRPTVE